MDAQTANTTLQSTGVKEKVREPSMCLVHVLNDDVTEFEFVVYVLVNVFGKTPEEGWRIAEQTHVSGRGLVGRYTRDVALTKIAKATKIARDYGFPLRFSAEPEK